MNRLPNLASLNIGRFKYCKGKQKREEKKRKAAAVFLKNCTWVTWPGASAITLSAPARRRQLRPHWRGEGVGLCVDISHSPLGCPCQSQAMWLQESPPALSLTPPIDFPSRRSVSPNRFNQGDPLTPPPPLTGADRAGWFVPCWQAQPWLWLLSTFIFSPGCVTPCTRTSLTLKKRNSFWEISSPWP